MEINHIYIFCVFAAISAAIFLARSAWETRQLTAEKYIIKSRYANERLRIAFLCDIHDRLTEEGIESIYSLTKAAAPDVMLLGGDIFTLRKQDKHSPDTSQAVRLVKRLSSIGPVIYAEGNHEMRLRERFPEEFERFRQDIEDNGGLFLIDDHVVHKGTAIYGLSLDDPYYRALPAILGGKYPMPVDYIIKKIGLPEKNCVNILLIHTPEYLKEAADWGASLVLSGHYHGGTIRLPYFGGLMTPQFRFFVKECAGLHHHDGASMVVSRGIGTHSINLRINDLPEIPIIDIMPDD